MASRSETDKAHEKICEVTAEYFLTHKKEVFFLCLHRRYMKK